MSAGNPRVEAWVQSRLAQWQAVEENLPTLESNKPVDTEAALQAIRTFPEIARDLAIARRALPDARVTAFLGHTYARLYRALFRAPRAPLTAQLAGFRDDIPRIVGLLGYHIAAVTAWFILSILAGWWLVATYPELVTLFASERMIETVQGGGLWTDGLLNVTPSSVLSVSILTNNIVVALTALSLGVFYGLGTLYIIGLNGLMLGGVFAFTHQHGLGLRLFEFVCAHGFVELSVICIAGAIGFSLGEALARPGHLSRAHALQRAASRGLPLMALCVVFLVGAGIIEGYVSPNSGYALSLRLGVGVAYLVLFLWALSGFRLPRPG